MKKMQKTTRNRLFAAGTAVIALLLSCGIFAYARGHLKLSMNRELTEEELRVKEELRVERMEELEEHYKGYSSSQGYGYYSYKTLDHALGTDICAVVKVTKGREDSLKEDSVLWWYNDFFGTDYESITDNQRQALLEAAPHLSSYVSDGQIAVEVEEYLFDRTGLYLPELTLTTSISREFQDLRGWGTEGMRLVVFCQAPREASQVYEASEHWGYIISDAGYLVPLDTFWCEDGRNYGGLQLSEYKEIIQEKKEEYERRKAILPYLMDVVSTRKWKQDPYGRYITLKTEEQGGHLGVYILGSLARMDSGVLIEREGGLAYLQLQRGETGYEVVDAYWNWDGQDTGEFPMEIRELAAQYGYPDAGYLEQMADETYRSEWTGRYMDYSETHARWSDYWSYEEVLPDKKELPARDEHRLARLEQLLPDYFKYYEDLEKEITYVAENLEYADSYEHLLTNLDHDICAIVEVTDGVEDTIEGQFYLKAYNEYFCTDFKELTGSQIRELAVAQPKTMELVQRGEMTVQVQEYLFDKTGLEAETLTIDAPLDRAMGRWKVAAGMKLILFLDAPDDASQLYDSSVAWAYYITEEGYLVPLTLSYHEDMLDYGGMELEEYKELILEGYESYEEPAEVTQERQSRLEQWGRYWDGSGVWDTYSQQVNQGVEQWLDPEAGAFAVSVETRRITSREEEQYHISFDESRVQCEVYDPEEEVWVEEKRPATWKRRLNDLLEESFATGQVVKVEENVYENVRSEQERVRYHFTDKGELDVIIHYVYTGDGREPAETRTFIRCGEDRQESLLRSELDEISRDYD